MSRPPRHQDRDFLKDAQYADDCRLSARAAIYQHYSTNPQPWVQWAFAQLDLQPDSAVLECGCGPGWLWTANADHLTLDGRGELILTDLSAGMVATARQALSNLVPSARYAVADISALPYREEEFDLVVANHMLYHVPDLQRALEEIVRVLRPGGRLVAATNGLAHLHELKGIAALLMPEVPWQRHSWIDSFALENGGALLSPYFTAVEQRRYDNLLAIDDPKAIIDYLASTDEVRDSLTAEDTHVVEEHIKREIEAQGLFRVTPETGLFIAHK